MKPEINLPRVYSGKISLSKSMFPRAKVRSVTSTINYLLFFSPDKLPIDSVYSCANFLFFFLLANSIDSVYILFLSVGVMKPCTHCCFL